MRIWRDATDRDAFHFGVKVQEDTYWCFSLHIDWLEDVFGEDVADMIVEEASWSYVANLESIRLRDLQRLANEVRDHCAAIAEQSGCHEVAALIKEYKHELCTEDG